MGDFFDSIDVSASALSAERLRMNTISSNLANAQTTRTPEGGPYRRKDPVFQANPVPEFSQVLKGAMEVPMHKVQVVDIVSDPNPPKMVYNPEHPDANPEGFVAMPNVNTMEEMVNMISASRSYQTNIEVMDASKRMLQQTLSLGQ